MHRHGLTGSIRMNTYSVATHTEISRYQKTELCKNLCGRKPFGSRHWEYPWAVEQSGILEATDLKILDVAPDLTFPYPRFLERLGHVVTFIDIERRRWSDTVAWGMSPERTEDSFHVMDVRQMTFPDSCFDCIFCISVLEHIVCPTQDPEHPHLKKLFDPLAARPAIFEMKRCLKPGGRLLITVDIYGGPKWSDLFSKWDIFSDLEFAGFPMASTTGFDREKIFRDPNSYISEFYGPYVTLGFKLEK